MAKKSLLKNGGYEVGRTYFIAYWRQTFTVEQIHNDGQYNWSVTVRWDDGHVNTHSTALERRDRIISMEAN